MVTKQILLCNEKIKIITISWNLSNNMLYPKEDKAAKKLLYSVNITKTIYFLLFCLILKLNQILVQKLWSYGGCWESMYLRQQDNSRGRRAHSNCLGRDLRSDLAKVTRSVLSEVWPQRGRLFPVSLQSNWRQDDTVSRVLQPFMHSQMDSISILLFFSLLFSLSINWTICINLLELTLLFLFVKKS